MGKGNERMEKLGKEEVRYLVNPLALELNVYSLAHHLCKM